MREIGQKIQNLTQLQGAVLLYLREGMSDEEIAKAAGVRNRSADAVRKHITNIGEALFPEEKEKEGRSQYRRLLKKLDIPREWLQPKEASPSLGPLEPLTGVVPMDSRFYMRRESDFHCQEILKANNNSEGTRQFIRIRGPQQTGKSSLLRRLQNFATQENQIAAFVDLDDWEYFEPEAFEDLGLLLQRFTEAIAETFCQSVDEVDPPNLREHWHENKAPGLNCTQYLDKFVFSQIHQPTVLLLDGLDRVLGTDTHTPFFELLRSWYERRMKKVDDKKIVWPSIAIAYSTEPYSQLGVKGSVLQNTGTVVELADFTPEQVRDLAGRYGLRSFSKNDIERLTNLIGGHPALVNQALYKISTEGMTVTDIESLATTIAGPFGDYLHQKFQPLHGNKSLLSCCSQAIAENACHDDFAKFQLLRVGLIDEDENGVKFKYEIYRKYYEEHFQRDRQNREVTNQDMGRTNEPERA